jgi:hypothetical protein
MNKHQLVDELVLDDRLVSSVTSDLDYVVWILTLSSNKELIALFLLI